MQIKIVADGNGIDAEAFIDGNLYGFLPAFYIGSVGETIVQGASFELTPEQEKDLVLEIVAEFKRGPVSEGKNDQAHYLLQRV